MEVEGGGVTPFWAETNQDFRRHRRHIRQNFRIPDGVFAVLLSPLVLISTLVAAAVLVSYIPALLSPLSRFLRRVLLFKSWEAFNLLLVLFAILTGIFSRNTNAGGHQRHHQESDAFASKIFEFPGKSEDRNGHGEVGGSRIIFHRSYPLRNVETQPAAVQEEYPLSLGLKAGWFPDDGWKTERYSSQGNLISADAHFQRHPGFGERSLGSPSSSSADAPPKTSKIDHDFLIQRRRSSTSFSHPSIPLENIDAEDGFLVPRRHSPPPLPPLGTINLDGGSNIMSKHFPPPLLSDPPETVNPDDDADVKRNHSRPPLVYHHHETMNSNGGCAIQRKHSSPPLMSLSPPLLPHSAYSHALEAPESKTKRRSRHRNRDVPSPPLAPSSSRKKEEKKKKKKEKEKEKEKRKSRGTEPPTEIPVPPSLPPPPLASSSFLHQWFTDLKNEAKMEKLRPYSDWFVASLPPSSLPLHLGTIKEASSSTDKRESARKENAGSRDYSTPQPSLPALIKEKQKLQIEFRSSSSDSSSGRSIPYLPPPPPPPFAEPDKSVVKLIKSGQTRRESRRVYEGLTEQSSGKERSGNSLFCSNPDVNDKADKFIARFHEGIRLEKLQSAKVREGVKAKR